MLYSSVLRFVLNQSCNLAPVGTTDKWQKSNFEFYRMSYKMRLQLIYFRNVILRCRSIPLNTYYIWSTDFPSSRLGYHVIYEATATYYTNLMPGFYEFPDGHRPCWIENSPQEWLVTAMLILMTGLKLLRSFGASGPCHFSPYHHL